MNRTVLFLLGFVFGVGFYAIVINTKIKFVELAEAQEPTEQTSSVQPIRSSHQELNHLLSASDTSLQKALRQIQQENQNIPATKQHIEKVIEFLHQAKQMVDDNFPSQNGPEDER